MGTQYTFHYPKLFTAPSRADPPSFLQSPRSAGAPSSLPFLPAIGTQAAAAALRLGLYDCVSGFPSGLRPPASHHAPSPPVLCTPAGDPACLPFSLLPPPVDRQRLVICHKFSHYIFLQKRNTEGGKQNASLKKAKKDKLVGATGKNVRTETSMVFVTLRVKPELTLPATPIEVEQSILEDLRNRAQLNNVALPSVSFYTFLNTHNGLNCSSISHDGSLVVGGFSDSSVKVWDMSKIGQPAKISSSQNENGCSHGEHISTLDEGKRTYTLFQGHSGPVYSAAFSPFGDFLLSSSSDLTIRLWSTKLNANLVCYKGHNYPVWDVQFSPVGHYFASASHDRTARIWSIDKIQPLRIMAGHLSDVDCVQWHVNCNYIATGSSDKTVRLWDVQTGECIRMFIGHRSMVLSLAMSPDGRYMASGDEDGTIMIWDLSTGRCVSPLLGHSSCVRTLAFRFAI
ncbi:transcription initiation factor TFIID subunit 5 [Zea mays]|uniref:transcription initiation factor TFIID subunit 5 n=1 Tax=Zea mays TaxID=4577 RepID=UPI0009AA2CAE|nr:transcription initiation factor TFIID subunit 5 [Zea mays]|eukprot:XP_020395278.1 transcription initiation factor TFIID subunit 5 [Zea mays]